MAILKLALLGASGSGKTRLAQELAANALVPPLLVDDHTPLQALIAGLVDRSEPFAAWAELLPAARAHLEKYDVTLLMGLDLPFCDKRQARERMDGLLRRCLAETGIAYQVIYGQGAERQQQAIQAIERLSAPAFQHATPETRTGKTNTGAPLPKPLDKAQKKSAWVWVCDKCSDAECEHRSLLARQADRLLQG